MVARSSPITPARSGWTGPTRRLSTLDGAGPDYASGTSAPMEGGAGPDVVVELLRRLLLPLFLRVHPGLERGGVERQQGCCRRGHANHRHRR